MSAWMILATVNFSWLVMQPNIYFNALYNYPSLIMRGHCSIKEKVASISATVHILASSDHHPLSLSCPLQFQDHHTDGEALLVHVGTAASNQQQQQLERLRLCLAQWGKSLGKLIFIWPQCQATGPQKGIIGYFSFTDKGCVFIGEKDHGSK